jgi:hypothetical protein
MPARLPNPALSRIVLIGVGAVPAKFDLPGLPGLNGLLTRLQARLTGTVEQPVTLYNPRSATKVCTAVRRAAAEATDLLLVYCAGHIQPDQHSRPRLILANSVPGELAATAVSMDELTGYITGSPAAIKVLLLDCDGWTVTLPDTATLAGGRSRTQRRTPTVFTEALLVALDNPSPPSFQRLRHRINQELVRRDEPKAQASAAHVALVQGPTSRQPLQDRPADAVPDEPAQAEVGKDPATVGTTQRGDATGVAVLDGVLGIGTAASALWLHASWGYLLTGSLAVILLLGLLGLASVVADRKRPGTTTMLQFDTNGITLRRLAADPVRVPWSDVLTAGLLPPSLCVHRPNDNRDNHVFTVKLRPDAPRPALDLLVPQADRLGCVGLAKVNDLDTTAHELLAVVDRFAQDKAAHSNRDWCARHPELRPLLD